MPAPIALFVYNRPEHTRQTLDALANNELAGETPLYIFSDGVKENALPEEVKEIDAVRTLIRNESRFGNINIIESPVNKGLATSIINGVTYVLQKYDTIIVLEDDILTGKYFLKFCNEALERYYSESRVMSISGFSFQPSKNLPHTFFLSIVACWGWATWKNRWEMFNPDAVVLLNEIKDRNKIVEFNFNNSYDYYALLQAQVEGRINSWAVRWYASIFLNNGLALYPSKSLTQNIGMDGTGTHYKGIIDKTKGGREVMISNTDFDKSRFTDNIQTDIKIERKFQKYLRNIYTSGVTAKIRTIWKAISG